MDEENAFGTGSCIILTKLLRYEKTLNTFVFTQLVKKCPTFVSAMCLKGLGYRMYD
jgi:hypothetical protein